MARPCCILPVLSLSWVLRGPERLRDPPGEEQPEIVPVLPCPLTQDHALKFPAARDRFTLLLTLLFRVLPEPWDSVKTRDASCPGHHFSR